MSTLISMGSMKSFQNSTLRKLFTTDFKRITLSWIILISFSVLYLLCILISIGTQLHHLELSLTEYTSLSTNEAFVFRKNDFLQITVNPGSTYNIVYVGFRDVKTGLLKVNNSLGFIYSPGQSMLYEAFIPASSSESCVQLQPEKNYSGLLFLTS
jgi:hypothetical protein